MILSRLLRFCLISGWAGLGLGLVLQFGLKDHLFGLRLLFYAMPKPCLLALAVILLVWPKAGKRSRLAAAITSLALASTWIASSWGSGPPAGLVRDKNQEVRILYWNLSHPTTIHQGMVDLIRDFKPHFAAFVEPGRKNMEDRCRIYESMLPGYKVEWMRRGILWASRVDYTRRDWGTLERSGAYACYEVTGLGPTFPVVVADVYPHPLHWRKGQLEDALSHTQGRSDALLMGDFNTPLESALLDGYRARYTHALEDAGEGFKETWPLGLPLLSLDHLWLGRDWQTVEARKVWALSHSDHAALLVTLRRKEK
ncbi:Endonuclease/Exonuclease/phosphatase family protein [Prosthecobacter fusiformis]|uniref:Endonuclease/Exonuclease/phosphatase family protein n=1 Tax=Prosthecobacter fusiformis TaxID=48464 RepID=A0A4R7RMY3_9BACT|nr:endonuclease/exonuclease/phosphatase family protein [Prosthecobacter fusiformis]TDU66148.1 Endonuclease/Exonuclease/phosphatase family protein [Prosthecobacter fusiformis]